MLKNLIRWVKSTKETKSDSGYPLQQVTYMGKVADSVALFPYGIKANVPPDTLGLCFSVQGNPDNRACFFADGEKQPLLQGEVVIYNPITRCKVLMSATGSVIINDLVTIDPAGNIATPATVSAAAFISPAMTITGSGAAFTGTVTANGKDISDTHGHTQGNDSSGDTQQPIVGVT